MFVSCLTKTTFLFFHSWMSTYTTITKIITWITEFSNTIICKFSSSSKNIEDRPSCFEMLTLATLNAKVLLCGILNAIILIWKHSPAGIHLLKVSNRNTTTMPLASFWCLYFQRWTNFFSMIFLWLLREIGYCWVCMSPSNQKYKFKFISCMYVYWGYYLHQTSATSLVENSDK